MSEEFAEYEITGSVGKYPKDAFTGIFKGYEYTENANKTKELRLNFDEDTVVTIYGRGKLAADGKAAGGLALWINSLAALNIKSYGIQQNGELIRLRHEPDITNAKISIEPDIKKTVGDTSQTKEDKWWGIAKHVILDTPAGKPVPKAPAKAKPAASKPQISNSDLETEIAEELIVGARSIRDLYDLFQKVHLPKTIKTAIESLKAQGKVRESVTEKDKFELI